MIRQLQPTVPEVTEDDINSQENDEDMDKSIACPIILFHSSILRIRRYLMSYSEYRLFRLTKTRFQLGPILPPDVKERLSSHEIEFLRKYNAVLNNYMKSIDIDVTRYILPPKGLTVRVQGIKDIGEIFTKNGILTIKKNNIYILKEQDAEEYVRKGYVVLL